MTTENGLHGTENPDTNPAPMLQSVVVVWDANGRFFENWTAACNDGDGIRHGKSTAARIGGTYAVLPAEQGLAEGSASDGIDWKANCGSLLSLLEYMIEATGEGPEDEDAVMLRQISDEFTAAMEEPS